MGKEKKNQTIYTQAHNYTCMHTVNTFYEMNDKFCKKSTNDPNDMAIRLQLLNIIVRVYMNERKNMSICKVQTSIICIS